MIVETLLNVIYSVLTTLLGFITLPAFPAELTSGFNSYLSIILDNAMGIISFILPWNIIKIGLPIALVVGNAKHIYHFVMWILAKIPMLNIR